LGDALGKAMTSTSSNPFRRPGCSYPLFSCQNFLDSADLNPLSAKAQLLTAVEAGHITFPHGTSDQRPYTHFWGTSSNPDSQACESRYGHLPVAIDKLTGFPLDFVLELLDRIAAGEHPYFTSWAQSTLEDLFCCIPDQAEGGEELIYYPAEIQQ
jgi:hypothetical protein